MIDPDRMRVGSEDPVDLQLEATKPWLSHALDQHCRQLVTFPDGSRSLTAYVPYVLFGVHIKSGQNITLHTQVNPRQEITGQEVGGNFAVLEAGVESDLIPGRLDIILFAPKDVLGDTDYPQVLIRHFAVADDYVSQFCRLVRVNGAWQIVHEPTGLLPREDNPAGIMQTEDVAALQDYRRQPNVSEPERLAAALAINLTQVINERL